MSETGFVNTLDNSQFDAAEERQKIVNQATIAESGFDQPPPIESEPEPPADHGDYTKLLEEVGTEAAAKMCPHLKAMGAAGIELANKINEMGKDPDRKPTFAEIVAAKKAAKAEADSQIPKQAQSSKTTPVHSTKSEAPVFKSTTEVTIDRELAKVVSDNKTPGTFEPAITPEAYLRDSTIESHPLTPVTALNTEKTVKPESDHIETMPIDQCTQNESWIAEQASQVIAEAEQLLRTHTQTTTEPESILPSGNIQETDSEHVIPSQRESVTTERLTEERNASSQIAPEQSVDLAVAEISTLRVPSTETTATFTGWPEEHTAATASETVDGDQDLAIQVYSPDTQTDIDTQPTAAVEPLSPKTLVELLNMPGVEGTNVDAPEKPTKSAETISETPLLHPIVESYISALPAEQSHEAKTVLNSLIDALEAYHADMKDTPEPHTATITHIEKLVGELLHNLGINNTDSQVHAILQELLSPEALHELIEDEQLTIEQLSILGTHEQKTTSLRLITSSLIGIIRQTMNPHAWLGGRALSAA